MELVMFGRLVSKEAGRLYSFYVSASVRVNRTVGTFPWPRLVQTHLQRYLTYFVLMESANGVT